MALALAFLVLPFTGSVVAGEPDDIGVQCHAAKIYVRTWANKYDLAPSEQFTQYVTVYVSTEVYPLYLAGYMRDTTTGAWSGAEWQYSAQNACYSRTYAFNVDAPEDGGQAQVWAFARGGGYPTPYTASWSDAFTINVRAPDLELDRVTPSVVDVGEAFTSRFTVRNTGTDTAFDVSLEETLGSGFTLLDGGHSTDGNTVQWSLGDLAPGESRTVTYAAEAAEAGAHALVAVARGDARWGTPVVTDPAVADVRVRAPRLAFEHAFPESVASGELFEVVVTYRNVGDLEARALTLSDAFDSDYTPVPVDVRVTNVGDPTVVSPRVPALEYAYGAPEAREREDPVRVKGDEETTFTWTLDALAPGDALVVRYHLVAPVRHAVASVVTPDAEAPALLCGELPEDVCVNDPTVGEPTAPDAEDALVVDENAGEYAFRAGAAFSAPAGVAFADASDLATQIVRAAHQEEAPPVEAPVDVQI